MSERTIAPPLRSEAEEHSLSPRTLWLIYAGLLALFVANALRAAVANSAVCDELGAHIPAGLLYWTSGQFSGGLSNFPLGQLLIAGPVHWLGHSYELYSEQHLLLFRLPVIFMGALLGALVAHLATRLYGERGGIAALFLYALSPNMLAHSSLATLDLPTALFVFLAIDCLYSLLERPSPLRVLALAGAVGLALVTKVQAIVLLGLVPILLLVFWRRLVVPAPRSRGALWAAFLVAPLLVIALIDGVYLHTPSVESLLPPQFTAALEAKLLHASRGHFAYLMGDYTTTGWWYYFPVAMALKTPVPVLILFALGVVRRPSLPTAAFALAPLLLFLGIGLLASVDIGLRHILIVYPFLFLLAARGAVALLQRASPRPRLARTAVIALAAGYIAQAVFISPHHLSYFNVLAGGPTRGHFYLIDSNYDWGQNDHYLRRHVAASDLSYQINPDSRVPTTGNILVNTNALYGVLNGGPLAYRWLRDFEPVRQIAYTWFEFEVPAHAFPSNESAFGGVSRLERDRRTRRELVEHLLALQARHTKLASAGYRLFLAQAFSALGAYDVAFETIRSVLANDPTSERALTIGGELIVRHKLGVLSFETDQYLSGVKTPRPEQPLALAPEVLVERSRSLDVGTGLSRLYTVLGVALGRHGQAQPNEARELFQLALRLDRNNRAARKRLDTLR